MILGRAARAVAEAITAPVPADPSSTKGPEWGKAAPIGLLVIVLLCVAVYFLIKSLNRNLKKVPGSFHSAEPVPAGVSGIAGGRMPSAAEKTPGGTSDESAAGTAGVPPAGTVDPGLPGPVREGRAGPVDTRTR